jgi:protocatechuate 3,4-dioxygenase beta subunit
LTGGATLRGKVALASGEPVAGAEVRLYSRDWWTLGLSSAFKTTTDDDGNYAISGLPLGRASVAVRAEGCYQPGFDWSTGIWRHEESSAGLVVPERGEIVKDVTLVRGGVVSGLVRDPDGNPIPDAAVTIRGGGSARAISGPDGTFRISGVHPGPDRVARAYGRNCRRVRTSRPSAESEPFVVRPDVPTEGVVVVLATGATVSGRVTDEAGRPVPGVELRVAWESARGSYGFPERFWRTHPVCPVESDGSFQVEGLAAGKVLFVASAQGYADSATAPIPIGPSGRHDGIRLVLAAERPISGRVSGPDGDALSGVEIRVVRVEECRSAHQSAARALTADDGAFAIPGLAKGRWVIIARRADFADTAMVVAAGTSDVRITLGSGLSISGIVTDRESGDPVAGVHVAADSHRGDRDLPGEDHRTRTGRDGRFALTGLRPGAYRVRAGSVLDARREDPEYAPEEGRFVEAGTEGLRIKLTRALVISGRVTDPDGRPVPFVGIKINGRGDPSKRDPAHFHHPETDLHGRFRISRLPAGRYDLRFSERTSRGRAREGFFVTRMMDVRAGTEGIEVVMRRGLSISGRVVGFDGEPPSGEGELRVAPTGAKITGSSNPWAPVRLAADGTFATRPLDPESTWDLRTEGFPGADTGYVRRLTAGTEGVIVRLVRGLTISGRVLDEAGGPAVGVRVAAYPEQNDRNLAPRYATSGDDGRFVIQALAESTYRLLGGGVGQDWEKLDSVTVRAGTDGVVIKVRRLCRISGRVVNDEGEPVRCSVGWRQKFSNGSRSSGRSTDNEGRFTITGLRPGTVTLRLGLGSRRVVLGEFTAPQEGLVLTVP